MLKWYGSSPGQIDRSELSGNDISYILMRDAFPHHLRNQVAPGGITSVSLPFHNCLKRIYRTVTVHERGVQRDRGKPNNVRGPKVWYDPRLL